MPFDVLPTPAGDRHDVVGTMTRLVQAQTRAVALQQLPPLRSFTGEGKDVLDNGFEQWLERFLELARYAGWSQEEQLYQLKSRLDKSAQETFRMLPEEEKRNVSTAINSLRRRFKPRDIEEL